MNFDLLREIVEIIIGGVDLGIVVQMGVDVAGRSDVAVAQPFLDVLEGYAVGIEKGRAGVPEIVKPDAPHSVLFQKLRKRLREIPRLDPVADCVDVDIVQISVSVLAAGPRAHNG